MAHKHTQRFCLLFKKITVYVYVCMHMPQCTFRSQSTILWIKSLSTFTRVLGIQLGSPGLYYKYLYLLTGIISPCQGWSFRYVANAFSFKLDLNLTWVGHSSPNIAVYFTSYPWSLCCALFPPLLFFCPSPSSFCFSPKCGMFNLRTHMLSILYHWAVSPAQLFCFISPWYTSGCTPTLSEWTYRPDLHRIPLPPEITLKHP